MNLFEEDDNIKEFVFDSKSLNVTYLMQSYKTVKEGKNPKFHKFVVIKHLEIETKRD